MKKLILGWCDAIRFKTRVRLAKVSRFFYVQKTAFKGLPKWHNALILGAALITLMTLWWCL
ncbi:hypothetical protein KFE96_06730 [Kordiimonas sp. SCSIO 12603]|uniref:hypothetical protein n=1 Tax=Kordiimonas sp. SCSIO 12603 TaxID=2829596 RepID=UPI00210609F4|nr:hypothetical protein [Kordiimonas sp. SCSIO 12603]UTW59996.1 hypothetical protein KFE96_06730 [Kordiimonas sp. SCSIO 12603]